MIQGTPGLSHADSGHDSTGEQPGWHEDPASNEDEESRGALRAQEHVIVRRAVRARATPPIRAPTAGCLLTLRPDAALVHQPRSDRDENQSNRKDEQPDYDRSPDSTGTEHNLPEGNLGEKPFPAGEEWLRAQGGGAAPYLRVPQSRAVSLQSVPKSPDAASLDQSGLTAEEQQNQGCASHSRDSDEVGEPPLRNSADRDAKQLDTPQSCGDCRAESGAKEEPLAGAAGCGTRGAGSDRLGGGCGGHSR